MLLLSIPHLIHALSENTQVTEMLTSPEMSRHERQCRPASKRHSKHLYPRRSQHNCPWSHRYGWHSKSKHRGSLFEFHGSHHCVCTVGLPIQRTVIAEPTSERPKSNFCLHPADQTLKSKLLKLRNWVSS